MMVAIITQTVSIARTSGVISSAGVWAVTA